MKRLLLTGGCGFIGRNVKPLLDESYEVTTLGLNTMNDIQTDLSAGVPPVGSCDVVLHTAGKAHFVPRNDEEVREFYDINYQGTVNLCASLEKAGLPEAFIFVSTIAVYGCDEGLDIDESYSLNAKTPYAKSKLMAERFLNEWCHKHGVRLAIIRPPLVVGPNPPGNLGRLIEGVRTGRYLCIGEGKAKKSVLMVQDIARLVPLLEKTPGIYNVCSDDQPTFRDIEELVCGQLKMRRPKAIPLWAARILARIGDGLGSKVPINTRSFNKITQSLTFSNKKAKSELGWKPLSIREKY